MANYKEILRTTKPKSELKNNPYFDNLVATQRARKLFSSVINDYTKDSQILIKHKLHSKMLDLMNLDYQNDISHIKIVEGQDISSFDYETWSSSISDFIVGVIDKAKAQRIKHLKYQFSKVAHMHRLVNYYNESRDYRNYSNLIITNQDGETCRLFSTKDLPIYKKYLVRAIKYYDFGRLLINVHQLTIYQLAHKYNISLDQAKQLAQHKRNINPVLNKNYHKHLPTIRNKANNPANQSMSSADIKIIFAFSISVSVLIAAAVLA